MTNENIFTQQGVDNLLNRLDKVSSETKPKWGKMTAPQMVAHLNVAYEMTLEDKHKRPNAIARFLIKILAKPTVVGPKPYPKNGRTAPEFIIKDQRDIAIEKQRLKGYMSEMLAIGGDAFHNRESHAMGKLTKDEWNMLFAKHMDHHLQQFGV